MASLFVVSTPIGNLKDISLRAIETFYSVDVIACEDTRRTDRLLKKLQGVAQFIARNFCKLPARNRYAQALAGEKFATPQLFSYYEENEKQRIPQILKLLKQGKNVALVSNAGTPLISDPGFKLVRECIRQKIKVVSIPGASAVLPAITSSGLPTDKFLFLGFLPKKSGKRKKILQNLTFIYQYMKVTVVVYLSPYRLVKELQDLKKVFGEIEVVVCRELTKLHEEIHHDKISKIITFYQINKPKGEFSLVFRLKK